MLLPSLFVSTLRQALADMLFREFLGEEGVFGARGRGGVFILPLQSLGILFFFFFFFPFPLFLSLYTIAGFFFFLFFPPLPL